MDVAKTGTRTIRARRWSLEGGRASATDQATEVVREEALIIEMPGAGEYVLLCTLDDPEALAVGFAFSEGLIGKGEEVRRVAVERTGPWTSRVRLETGGSPPAALPRTLIVSSSCGSCGRPIEDGLMGPPVGRTLAVPAGRLVRLAAEMRRRQTVFGRTGGAHAAALFDAAGEIRAFAEDLGRHNALDKAVGRLLRSGGSPRGLGALVSGRLSYELAVKAGRGGLEILAGISAPSSLAVEAAGSRGITLCGFVREDRLTVYSHPDRITG